MDVFYQQQQQQQQQQQRSSLSFDTGELSSSRGRRKGKFSKMLLRKKDVSLSCEKNWSTHSHPNV